MTEQRKEKVKKLKMNNYTEKKKKKKKEFML